MKEIWLIIKRERLKSYVIYATEDRDFAFEKMQEYKADYIQSCLLLEKKDIDEIKLIRKAKGKKRSKIKGRNSLTR